MPTKSSKPEPAQEERQQKYLQFQLLQQQIEQLSPQLETLTQQFAELEISQDALNNLQKTPLDREILASLAPGIFLKASLKDNQRLIVNVGASAAAEKTLPQVQALLAEQKEELEKTISQTDALLQAFTQQALRIYQDLAKKEEKEIKED